MKGAAEMKQGLKITSFPIDFDKIGQILLIVIAMYLISAVFNFLQQVYDTCFTTNSL